MPHESGPLQPLRRDQSGRYAVRRWRGAADSPLTDVVIRSRVIRSVARHLGEAAEPISNLEGVWRHVDRSAIGRAPIDTVSGVFVV